jgi:hypothetical protein
MRMFSMLGGWLSKALENCGPTFHCPWLPLASIARTRQ